MCARSGGGGERVSPIEYGRGGAETGEAKKALAQMMRKHARRTYSWCFFFRSAPIHRPRNIIYNVRTHIIIHDDFRRDCEFMCVRPGLETVFFFTSSPPSLFPLPLYAFRTVFLSSFHLSLGIFFLISPDKRLRRRHAHLRA